MPQRCDPYIFFNSLRVFLGGFKNTGREKGLVFKGVDHIPKDYTGASGAQSTVLPSLDALLGIRHTNQDLRHLLDNLVKYMPSPHQKFLKSIPSAILRDFVDKHRNRLPELQVAYDTIVEQIVVFRGKHLEYATKYIVKQGNLSSSGNCLVGTGGTPFLAYLRCHLKNTEKTKYLVKKKEEEMLGEYALEMLRNYVSVIGKVLGKIDLKFKSGGWKLLVVIILFIVLIMVFVVTVLIGSV